MRRFAAAFQSKAYRFVALLGIVMASAIVFLFAAGAPGSGPCAGYGMCGVLGLGEPFAFGECSLVHAAPNLRTAGFSDDAKTGLPSNASELSSESALVSGSAPASDLSSDPGPARTVRAVEEFLQYPAGLPSGCEPVSIALALRSLGFEIDPAGFIDAYVRLDPTWSDPALFLGSPYDVAAGIRAAWRRQPTPMGRVRAGACGRGLRPVWRRWRRRRASRWPPRRPTRARMTLPRRKRGTNE